MNSDTKHFRELPAGMCNWLVPPNIEGMMTATKYARQTNDGAVTLFYIDGTEETRRTDMDIVKDFSSYLGVVSFVQAGRP